MGDLVISQAQLLLEKNLESNRRERQENQVGKWKVVIWGE